MKRRVMLTCAVTGESYYNRAHPRFPGTPGQIAEAAIEAQEDGATAVHLHVRNPATGNGSRDPARLCELVERAVRLIRDLGCEVATPDETRELPGRRAAVQA